MGLWGKKNAFEMRTPLARSDRLVVEQVGDEVLIYDQDTAAAHCLSPHAAAVWRACDGQTTNDQIAAKLDLDPEAVRRALEELERCALLETLTVPSGDGVTRRQTIVRLSKVGAAAAAAPLIYSIAMPTPAMAVSQAFCLGQGCGHGCSTCFEVNCCCCCPGSGDTKHCTADCTAAHCSGPAPCPGTGCMGACHGGMGESNPCSS